MPADRNRPGRRRPAPRARLLAEPLEIRRLLTTILVDTADDDGATGGDTLSLRQAIEISDGTLALSSLSSGQSRLVFGALGTSDTIDFAIPGPGPFVIEPTSGLPAITSPVVIDGYSQPGTHPDTYGPGLGDDAVLQVELNGAEAYGADGLDIRAGGSTVEGLAIGGFTPLPYKGSSTGCGILLEGRTGDLIRGNFVGTDASGTQQLLNGVGVEDSNRFDPTTGLPSPGFNTIGGPGVGDGNVISGDGDGVGLTGSEDAAGLFSAAADLVEGNLIGTDAAGTAPLGNGDGIRDNGGGPSTIGGTAAGAGNVIAGNGDTGLLLGGYTQGNTSAFVSSLDLVQGNRIGIDVSGTAPLPNNTGVEVYATSSTIGGTAAGAGNVISGNRYQGLDISGQSTSVTTGLSVSFQGSHASVLLEGNRIGTDAAGTSPLPNGGAGINLNLTGGDDVIGGTAAGAGNVIANNGGVGVGVEKNAFVPGLPFAVQISGNSIFGNGGGGIVRATPSPVAAPSLGSATTNGSGSVIQGSLEGAADASYTVEFFANLGPDPSGFGQGRTYLGSAPASTDAAGHASFTFSTPDPLAGLILSATATSPSVDTSEFAADLLAVASTPTPTPTPITPTATTLAVPSGLLVFGQPGLFVAQVVTGTGAAAVGTIRFTSDGMTIDTVPLGSTDLASLSTSQLSPGSHSIGAFYAGDVALGQAASFGSSTVNVLPTVAYGGPTVISLGSPTLDSIKITFSRPLLGSTAEDPANYAVIGPGGQAVAIESANYDPADDSVTLFARRDLKAHRTYRVVVAGHRVGRVEDLAGVSLAGKHGRPGTSFTGKVTTGAAAPAKRHTITTSKSAHQRKIHR